MKSEIRQLINSCYLYAWTDETQTTTAAPCSFLPYAVGLRGNFARWNSHDVCPIRRAINSKEWSFHGAPLLSPQKGSATTKEACPPFCWSLCQSVITSSRDDSALPQCYSAKFSSLLYRRLDHGGEMECVLQNNYLTTWIKLDNKVPPSRC